MRRPTGCFVGLTGSPLFCRKRSETAAQPPSVILSAAKNLPIRELVNPQATAGGPTRTLAGSRARKRRPFAALRVTRGTREGTVGGAGVGNLGSFVVEIGLE